MGSSDVDDGLRESSFNAENGFQDDKEILEYLEMGAPTSWKSGMIPGTKRSKKKKWRTIKDGILLEGYVGEERENSGGGRLQNLKGENELERCPSKDFRSNKSLTDEDLDELKGCFDLGFGFSYEEIPELCTTLPALELCYSISQRFMEEHQKSPSAADSPLYGSAGGNLIANWRISSPGRDHPDQVKARLKYWAQAVACTVKLCCS